MFISSDIVTIDSHGEISAENSYQAVFGFDNFGAFLSINGVSRDKAWRSGAQRHLVIYTPVFIGGIYPSMELSSNIGVKLSFHGCIDSMVRWIVVLG